METMKEMVGNSIRSSGWLVWATLAAVYAPLNLPKMYFNQHLRRYARRLIPFLDPFVTVDIVSKSSRSTSSQLKSNDAFEEVKAYLSSECSRDVLGLCAEGSVKDDSFLLSLREGQEVADHFRNVTIWWLLVPPDSRNRINNDKDCLRLMFPQKHRELILEEYLPHIRREGRNLMSGIRSRRLYTNKRGRGFERDDVWSHVDFEHPATFDTLAMHPDKKRRIKEDLDSFSRNKDYYRRIGKPWKRGYLLHGPPGTGKSSMIAAMANYLNYDIYDIELTTVHSNSDLRKLFIETTGKSIIVIEDIDCSLDNLLTAQRSHQKKRSRGSDDSSKVTLSGLLNFLDGVWSAQSGERIIVLTTNFKDKLDQALIRRGRMDFHVEMSYCGFEAFTTLARNYLGVEGRHHLFGTVEELLQVVKITPADVTECLIPSQADVTDRDVEICTGRLIDELEKTKAEEDHEVEDKAAAKPKRQRRHR